MLFKCEKQIIGKDGITISKPKKKFDTLDKAIEMAKMLNSLDDHFEKLVSYKCTTCHKYHIGRNGTQLTEKDKKKLKQEKINNIFFKIRGWIDLDKIKY